jgi:hypothetical protein
MAGSRGIDAGEMKFKILFLKIKRLTGNKML